MKVGRVKLTKAPSTPAATPVENENNHSSASDNLSNNLAEFSKYIQKLWRTMNVEVSNYFKKGKEKSNQQQHEKPLLKKLFPKLTENQMQYVRWGTIVLLLVALLCLSTGLKLLIDKRSRKQIW